MINDIAHVTIPVKDQDRALAFYTKILGFEVCLDASFGEGMRWIEMGLKNTKTRLVLFTAPDQEHLIGTPSPIIFQCDDVRETYDQLAAKGVEFTLPPKDEAWGTYALFKDVDGNLFCLGEPQKVPSEV